MANLVISDDTVTESEGVVTVSIILSGALSRDIQLTLTPLQGSAEGKLLKVMYAKLDIIEVSLSPCVDEVNIIILPTAVLDMYV